MTDILIELCNLAGPSGFEAPVAERVQELIRPYMDETRIDVLGSVIGVRRCGKKDAVKLLFDAHIDEPGLIITGVEEGFLRFATLGGLDTRMLPASQVCVLSDPPLVGVVCALPPHVVKKEDAENALKTEELFIDVGLNQEQAEQAVPLGTAAVFANTARRLGDKGFIGKALDDRAGVYAILRALELLKGIELQVDLFVLLSVQEEVGTRGAGPGTFSVAPDYCVVVDVGHAKTPDTKPHEAPCEMGAGVIISRGPNMNTRFTDKAVRFAKEHEIPHQIEIEPGDSGTNARVIQVTREGVATALVGIPQKYMHGAFESVSLDDIESTARLLCEIAKECGND